MNEDTLLQPNERFWEKASGEFPLLILAELGAAE